MAKEPDTSKDQLAFISLGSNLGDAPANIRRALDRLQILSARLVLRSSLWETSPVDCPEGSPSFINAAAGLLPLPHETPESMLAKLQIMEKEAGRRSKKVVNEPRLLDLDLIVFGRETRNSPELVLPHPRALLRMFVLLPLSEIAAELVLPGQEKPVEELLAKLRSGETLTRLP